MHGFGPLLVILGLLLGAEVPAAAPPVSADQWVAVTAPEFRKALEPLIQARRAEGFRVKVLLTTDVLAPAEISRGEAGKLRERIHQLCRSRGRNFVLLVGAVEADFWEKPERILLPALPGTQGRMKGQPSDNGYGCPDGGLMPNVAVGRFPVRTEAEAAALVRRVLAFERAGPGDWKRRLTVLAGVPAYNPVVDRLVENLALARLGKIDPAWTGRAIYSNSQSKFCVPDSLLRKTATREVEGGAAFVLYLGHSSPEGLYGGGAPYLSRKDWATLKIERGAGVFLTFGCNGCQLKGEGGEGYAVAAVRNPKGPVAAVGSQGICFAALVQLAADGLFRNAFQGEGPERLGSAWLALKRGLSEGSIDPVTYAVLDAVDGDSTIPQTVQRKEHLEMFTLLGDPALRLPRVPRDLKIEVGPVRAGQVCRVKGLAPTRLEGARVRVSLERLVNSEPVGLVAVPKEGPGREAALLANWRKANDFVVATVEAEVRAGAFEVDLEVPAALPWREMILRVHAANERHEAQVASRVPVKK